MRWARGSPDGRSWSTSIRRSSRRPPATSPPHFLAAFGPRAGSVAGTAAVVHTDLDEQRAWERQRESDVAFYQHAAAELEEMRAWAREQITRFDEWRAYIHELEGKLGLPPS